jgi:hypothetical protein
LALRERKGGRGGRRRCFVQNIWEGLTEEVSFKLKLKDAWELARKKSRSSWQRSRMYKDQQQGGTGALKELKDKQVMG